MAECDQKETTTTELPDENTRPTAYTGIKSGTMAGGRGGGGVKNVLN